MKDQLLQGKHPSGLHAPLRRGGEVQGGQGLKPAFEAHGEHLVPGQYIRYSVLEMFQPPSDKCAKT